MRDLVCKAAFRNESVDRSDDRSPELDAGPGTLDMLTTSSIGDSLRADERGESITSSPASPLDPVVLYPLLAKISVEKLAVQFRTECGMR